MDIEKAREIPLQHMTNQNQDCGCHLCNRCDGFVEGWESRQAEVDELKKVIYRLKNPIEGIDVSEFYPEESK